MFYSSLFNDISVGIPYRKEDTSRTAAKMEGALPQCFNGETHGSPWKLHRILDQIDKMSINAYTKRHY
jgi:hypothetical protein